MYNIITLVSSFLKKPILLLILLVALILRIIYLGEIPPGLAHDEIHVILNTRSLLTSGQNIPGTLTGIIGSVSGEYQTGVFSELGAYMLIPWVLLFGLTWPLIKIPFVLTSIGIILLTYLITKRLVNEKVALFAAAISAVNPWSIHFGRSAFESLFSFFFYSLAFYLAISLKGWKILLSIPFFLLGFGTYFAAKPQFIPLVFLSVLAIKITRPKEPLKPLITLVGCLTITFLVYLFALQVNPASSRFSELKSSSSYNSQVNVKRTASLNFPFPDLYVNKYTEEFQDRFTAYLGALSPNYLFMEGQLGGADALTLPDQGPMFLIDLPLIIMGFIYLSRFFIKPLIIFLGFIAVSLIPNFVNLSGQTFPLRSGLLYPFLIIFSASGAYYLIDLLKRHRKAFFVPVIALFYLYFFLTFSYNYFARSPIEKSGGWFLHERVLARYLNLAKSQSGQTDIKVVTPEPKELSYEYLFFTGAYLPKDAREINDKLAKKDYHFGQITFLSECPKSSPSSGQVLIFDNRIDCQKDKKEQIASPKDSGARYYIINDTLCSNYPKSRYPLIKKAESLSIEKNSVEDFCKTWITDPSQAN